MGTWLTATTYQPSGAGVPLWKTGNGYDDAGFMYFQQVLRAGSQNDCTAVTATWNYCAEDLVHVINGLYNQYTRISQTWSGAAADAFYAEMARVQNFAYAMLQNISSQQQQGISLISGAMASSGQGSTATATAPAGGVPTLQQVASGSAVLEEATGSAGGQPSTGSGAGSTTIPSTMVDVLADCAQVIAKGSNLADATLHDPYSGNPITGATAEVVLAGWMCGQAWNDRPPITLEFYSGLVGFAVAAVIAPELVATMEAVVAIAAVLNTPFGQAIGDFELNSVVGQVLMETLTWHAPGPARYATALAHAWTTNAQALPDPLDPSQTTSGTSSNTNQNTTNDPGYTPMTTPSPATFQPPTTTTTGTGSPDLGTGTGTGTGTDPGYTPTGYDPSGLGSSPYSGLGTGLGPDSGGSLASFNPNGTGADGLDAGAGLGGAGAAGDQAGAGSGLSGAGSAGAAGRAMPMMPGGGAGGGKDGKDRNRNVYLPEEEDVWGANGDVSDGVL